MHHRLLSISVKKSPFYQKEMTKLKGWMCWLGVFLEKKTTPKPPNNKTSWHQSVRQEKNYLYSGTAYPTSRVMNCVCASHDVYEGKNTASNNIRMLSSCLLE